MHHTEGGGGLRAKGQCKKVQGNSCVRELWIISDLRNLQALDYSPEDLYTKCPVNYLDSRAFNLVAEATGSSCLCLDFPNDCFSRQKCFAKIFCIQLSFPSVLERLPGNCVFQVWIMIILTGKLVKTWGPIFQFPSGFVHPPCEHANLNRVCREKLFIHESVC